MHHGQLTGRLDVARFLLCTCGVLLIFVGSTLAHNKQKEAADLLTRAANASSFEAGHQPAFRETVHFVVRGAEGDAEGQYTRDSADPKTQREEMVIGGFRELWVRSNGQAWDSKQGEFDFLAISRVRTSLPPRRRVELTPLDKVTKIESQDIAGVKAQCISFERTTQQKHVTEVACIEQERGVLLTLSTGDGWETRYSDYALFASKFLPRRLVILHNQVKLLDATINFEEAREFAADTFVPPPDAKEEKVVQVCTQIQPPKLKTQYPPSYPSAARARGAHGVVTIVAEIGKDGHVYKAHVKQPGDKDLDDAAIDAVQRWLYEPGTCNGSPVAVMTNISVNFAAP